MQLKPSRRSSLFLMELIISILLFSLASAFCVRIFVKSHTIETESATLDHAVTAATSVAEILRIQDDPSGLLKECYPEADFDDNNITIYFDQTWLPCSHTDSVYTLHLTMTHQDHFLNGDIQVSEHEDILYTLTVKTYKEGTR